MSRTQIFQYQRTTWMRQFYEALGKAAASGTMPAALNGPMEIEDNEEDDILDVGEPEIELDTILTDTYSSLHELLMKGYTLAYDNNAYQKELEMFDLDPEQWQLEKENCELESGQLKGTLEEYVNFLLDQNRHIADIQKDIAEERKKYVELQESVLESENLEGKNKSASKKKD